MFESIQKIGPIQFKYADSVHGSNTMWFHLDWFRPLAPMYRSTERVLIDLNQFDSIWIHQFDWFQSLDQSHMFNIQIILQIKYQLGMCEQVSGL